MQPAVTLVQYNVNKKFSCKLFLLTLPDNDGVHRVGNRSHVEKALTLHLYSPPFSTCHKYDDKSSKETEVPMGFDQDFTERCCPHTC